MLITFSPRIRSEEVPIGIGTRGRPASTLRTARSISLSDWMTRAGRFVPSVRWTSIPWTFSTT